MAWELPAGYPDHSPLSISAAGIWGPGGNCTGYVTMAPHFPEEESEDARIGTAAHELLEPFIVAAQAGGNTAPRRGEWVGKAATNGEIFTDEMFDAAEMYAENVQDVMRDTGVFGGPSFGFEERVVAPGVHPLFYGRLDTRLWSQQHSTLYVWDYKYGFGHVDVYQNAQLAGYALCVLDEMGVDGSSDQNITVVFRIVQPRAYRSGGPVQEWRCKASDLRAMRNIFITNAEEAFSDRAECRTGSHCRNCPARIGCPAALQAGLQLFEAAGQPTPVHLTPEQTGVQLALLQEAADRLKKMAEGFQASAECMLRAGKNVPGYRAAPKFGNEAWARPVPDVLAMGQMCGHDLAAEPSAKTPAQARKLGIDPAVVAAFSHKPNRGVKVVRDDGTYAKRIFSNG